MDFNLRKLKLNVMKISYEELMLNVLTFKSIFDVNLGHKEFKLQTLLRRRRGLP